MKATATHRHWTRWDHLPHSTRAQRVNRSVAVWVTSKVGTMWCAYLFALIALAGLPQAVQQTFTGGFHPLPLVQWIAQTFLQLVLLSIIIVGQNIQGQASDARAAHTFDDAEQIKTHTADLLEAVARVEEGQVKIVAAIDHALDPRGGPQ